jgi:hypothetical protein
VSLPGGGENVNEKEKPGKSFLLLLLLTFHSAHWWKVFYFVFHSPAPFSTLLRLSTRKKGERRKERLCHYCVTFTYLFKCLPTKRDKFIESFASEFSKPTITPIFHMPRRLGKALDT